MELNLSQRRIRSNRSYPTLNHISLAPLTPRFPVDDDPDLEDGTVAQDDYFSAVVPQQRKTSSYLASRSVPGTPGLFSSSRSASRTRYPLSRSSSRSHLGFLDSPDRDISTILDLRTRKKPSRQLLTDTSRRSDSEWILRTGIALTSSTREEKGQSWLEKRESSTSLVSLGYDVTTNHTTRHHHRGWSGWTSRSGTATPAPLSRRDSSSRSLMASRRNSKSRLAMAGLDISRTSRTYRSGATSPVASTGVEFTSDVIDEQIRLEIAHMQSDFGEAMSDLDAYSLSIDSDDEIDEQEMQRLTRERGFGLGSWIDRVVEWTLFGVDDLSSPLDQSGSPRARIQGTLRDNGQTQGDGDEALDDSDECSSVDVPSSVETTTAEGYDDPAPVKDPGWRSGWQDVRWLFRVIGRTLI